MPPRDKPFKSGRNEKLMSLAQLIQESPRLKRLGLMDEREQLQIYTRWPEIVGEPVARNARPLRFHRGALTVSVRSPAWMQELTLLKPRILENIREKFGRDLVTDLRFTLQEFRQG